jgi:hypothetical protein
MEGAMRKLIGVLLVVAAIATQPVPPAVHGDILQWSCSTTAWVDGGPYTIVVCPVGDGPTLASLGATITVRLRDVTGLIPIAGVPASDYWLLGCEDNVLLCGGSGSIDADGPSDVDGMATISGAIAGAGAASGTRVVVQGVIIEDCDFNQICLPIIWRSPDLNADLLVDIVDMAIFGPLFPSPPNAYDESGDLDNNGVIDIVDFAIFGGHFQHEC